MRTFVKLGMLGVMSLALAGCGGSDLQEGVPDKVDMTQDYSPKVDMPGLTPKVQAKARAEAIKDAKSAKSADQ